MEKGTPNFQEHYVPLEELEERSKEVSVVGVRSEGAVEGDRFYVVECLDQSIKMCKKCVLGETCYRTLAKKR